MSNPRIIKKYPNRRLYDTQKSKYITLSNVKELVMAGVEFQVLDTNSNEDLTRSILLQIIMEEESKGTPIFTQNTLAHLIQFYGGTVQGPFGQYLEQSLAAFSKQQDAFGTSANPLDNIAQATQQNIKIWSDMQQSFFQAGESKEEKS